MHPDLSHPQPVVRFATKKGRRMFLFIGSIVFVLACFFTVWVTAEALTYNAAQVTAWVLLIIGIVGVIFFGAITIGVTRNHLGSQGDLGVLMSPAGLVDRTQITGELPLLPWSIVAQYDIAEYNGQSFLLLQIDDVDAYRHITGSSRIMRWAFKANWKIFGVPVHAITVKHLATSREDLLRAIYQFTGLPPGHHISAGQSPR